MMLDEVSADFALGYLKVFSVIDASYQEYGEWKITIYRDRASFKSAIQ